MLSDTTGAPGGILALHLGDRVGWCYSSSNLGAWTLPNTTDHGCLGAALIDAVSDITKVLRPVAITLSGPPSEVETTTRPDVAVLHLGLLMCVRVFAYRRKLKMSVPNIGEIRGRMLGRNEFPRNGLRDAVSAFAKRRGMDKLDLDAGHALVLREYIEAITTRPIG